MREGLDPDQERSEQMITGEALVNKEESQVRAVCFYTGKGREGFGTENAYTRKDTARRRDWFEDRAECGGVRAVAAVLRGSDSCREGLVASGKGAPQGWWLACVGVRMSGISMCGGARSSIAGHAGLWAVINGVGLQGEGTAGSRWGGLRLLRARAAPAGNCLPCHCAYFPVCSSTHRLRCVTWRG